MFVIVAGAGLVGREITARLSENDHDVVAVDIDLEVCEMIYAETGAVTVHGNATELRTLREAKIDRADAFICLMRRDSDNIAAAILAKSMSVPRIVVRMRDPGYEEAYRLAGVTTIVRVADLLLNRIVSEIEQPRVKEIMPLGGGAANVYALRIPPEADCVGKSVSDIARMEKFPRESLFMGIYRDEEENFLIPRGGRVLKEDDRVFVIARPSDINGLVEVLTERSGGRLSRLLGRGGNRGGKEGE